MRLLLQRVLEARVELPANPSSDSDESDQIVGSINHGLLVFLGLETTDSAEMFPKMREKLLHLRIFDDDKGVPNRSVLDVQGEILVVSQFTLYANAKKGRRPSYTQSMPPAQAEKLYEEFVQSLRAELGKYERDPQAIQTGQFGAMMRVHLVNDGPFTIWLDSGEIL